MPQPKTPQATTKDPMLQLRPDEPNKYFLKDPYRGTLSGNVIEPQIEAIKSFEKQNACCLERAEHQNASDFLLATLSAIFPISKF